MDDTAQTSPAGQPTTPNAQPPINPTPTFAQEVKDLEKVEPPNQFQGMYDQGGGFKERLEAIASGFRAGERESVRVEVAEEIPENPELEPEVEGYIEKIEKDPELMKKMADDYVKTVGMQSANPQNPKVQIPLTDDQIKDGLHHKVWEAVRWLAEWCVRQMKILHRKLV